MNEFKYQPNLRTFLNPRNVAFAVLAVVYLYTVFFTYIHNRNSEGYILGDWLINYQDGGFKRRGLSGSFFFLLQDFTGLSLNVLVFTFQLFVISFFFFTFYRIIKEKHISWLYLSLILSSVGFVGLLNNVSYVGKKEFILFAIFAYYCLLIQQKKLTATKEWLICLLLFLSVLMHEIVLFFIPYFLIARYFSGGRAVDYLKLIASVFLPSAAILLFGHHINEGQSIEILKNRGVIFHDGIFFWDIDEKQILIDRFEHFFPYFAAFAISMLHIYYYLRKEMANHKRIGLALVVSFLYSLPLFYLGLDWGRWLYVHMMMAIILFAGLLPSAKLITENRQLLHHEKIAVPILIIIFSLIYRVELSGLFTFEGLFYRVFIVPKELLDKML